MGEEEHKSSKNKVKHRSYFWTRLEIRLPERGLTARALHDMIIPKSKIETEIILLLSLIRTKETRQRGLKEVIEIADMMEEIRSQS